MCAESLFDQIASLNQLNRRAKRTQFSEQLKRTRERILSISPLLAADSKVPLVQIAMAGDDEYKTIKAHEILVRLLEFFEGYVLALRPKRHRGDPIMPQLLLELAEISKLTTGEPDWKSGAGKIQAKNGIHHGKRAGRWALRTVSNFKRKRFGSFRRLKSWNPIDLLSFSQSSDPPTEMTFSDLVEWMAGWNAQLQWQSHSATVKQHMLTKTRLNRRQTRTNHVANRRRH